MPGMSTHQNRAAFAEPGDLTLLGSRTLEGLNVYADPVSKRLVDAGPSPAAPRQFATRIPT